jgi:adenylosuccinate synthase
LVRHACQVNGVTRLALTKLDVLTGLAEIPVCVSYQGSGGFPLDLSDAVPVFEKMAGWDADIRGARDVSDLPPQCAAYIQQIQDWVGVPVELVSVGPGREETFVRGNLFQLDDDL